MDNPVNPPKVFLSYSWENEEHKCWVLNLARRLRENGVNARLDRWHITVGQSLTQFMESEVQDADFVLVICTKEYARRALARTGGVGYEQQIISGNISAGIPREKFIPIVRDGDFVPGAKCSIPAQFLGVLAIDMRDDTTLDLRMEDLLRAIFKEPALTPPAIGTKPDFKGIGHPTVTQRPPRLAVLDIEGWHLLSGEASNELWPKSFIIPENSKRYSLNAGDTVKLQFEFALEDDEGKPELFGERMWVEVKGSHGPYLIGKLCNTPCCSDKQENLNAGDTVVFLPEHVIDIWEEDSE